MEATPLVDVIRVLRLAEAGWPREHNDFSTQAVASAGWNGYLNHEAKLTGEGRQMLDRLGFLCPEVA